MASLARAILITGEVGNGALGLYDSVKNPDSAILNVLGMLVGLGSIAKVSRDAPGLVKVAKVAKTVNFKHFGKVVKTDHDGLLTVLSNACKAK